MPTDAERLAVAEEWSQSCGHPILIRVGNLVAECVAGRVLVQKSGMKDVILEEAIGCRSRFIALADAVIAARAKLASEREAALPEAAKRWRKALEDIVAAHDEHPEKHGCGVSVQIARKALEQGA